MTDTQTDYQYHIPSAHVHQGIIMNAMKECAASFLYNATVHGM